MIFSILFPIIDKIEYFLKGFDKTTTEDSGSILSSTDTNVIGTGVEVKATGSFTIAGGWHQQAYDIQPSMSIGGANFIFTTASSDVTTTNSIFVRTGSNVTVTAENFRNAINNSSSFHNLELSACTTNSKYCR